MCAVPAPPLSVTLPVVCQPAAGATVVSLAAVPGSAAPALQLTSESADMEPQEVAARAGAARQSAAARHGRTRNARIRGFTATVIGRSGETCNAALFTPARRRPGRPGGRTAVPPREGSPLA